VTEQRVEYQPLAHGAPGRRAQPIDNERLTQTSIQEACQRACQVQKIFFLIAKKSLAFSLRCAIL